MLESQRLSWIHFYVEPSIYEISATSHGRHGSGKSSPLLTTMTDGGPPVGPRSDVFANSFLEPDSTRWMHGRMVAVPIVAKKWDPGILDPGPFLGQIRKVEARLGKLAKIRKVETD